MYRGSWQSSVLSKANKSWLKGLASAGVIGLVAVSVVGSICSLAGAVDDDGFKPIFNGRDLDGWDGNPKFWRVEEGAITGETTKDNPTSGNTFIIWRQGELDDFELKLEYRIVGGNSGIQYRSFEVPNAQWVIGGYQADFEAGDTYSGILYGERFRGILANRGEKTVIGPDHKPKVAGQVGDSKEIQSKIKKEDWNEYHVIAQGYHFVHKINGVVTAECTDEDGEMRRRAGLLALQLHAGPPMKVQFRNIRLKRLKLADKKKVVFMAGGPSHGYGDHEHRAGCLILAHALNKHHPGVLATVYTGGWAKDPTALDNADALVMYCDGAGGHIVMPHLKEVDARLKQGMGLVCIHFAVEITKGEPGDYFLAWLGGYFELFWSVNPHWTAEFKELPDHPITRGVKPFTINDEWYYHMRFRPGLEKVTPILTAIPPDSTRRQESSPRGGNPEVFARRGLPEHVAWAHEREDGGRGFGFTGGHVHWNWGHPEFRKLVLNAITWVAKAEVPEGGVPSPPLSLEDLEANQDQPPPANFDRNRIGQLLQQWNAPPQTSAAPRPGSQAEPIAGRRQGRRPAPVYESKLITQHTPGHAVDVDVDIRGAKQLFLVVTDGGNGYGCDWADWAEPRLVGPKGELKLTDLKWKSAGTDWGQVRVNRNAGGGPLKIAGKSVEYGIGTHANSVIEFDLPEGYERFKSRAGLDNGGTDQGDGSATSVQFYVFLQKPPAFLTRSTAPQGGGKDPAEALSSLDVAEGLEATLFAAEPMLYSPSNIEVDHLGRVWVCEIINYRRHNGRRPEGDRILVLQDCDGDGVAEYSTVFHQGREIDSPHGICVLGTPDGKNTKVLVSAGDSVVVFTDADGDLKADSKEVLFTGISGVQHDHGIHAFVFGPDGKLYFNFGNEGKQLKDKNGKLVIDQAGNEIAEHRKPYQQGMVFRCNLDGSEVETLGWNFRNNWEVAVDSFGTLWQSDNDDDGNRGVRINYVMEFGNYGYRDELTGAGWQSPRSNMEPEIPRRHWHLNDPGVVPTLLLTGAGSPTGILVYEGRLLPKVFWDQVIHCDAGPNVVRAYPVTRDGAGYKAEIVNILKGTRDQWFRPSDVCVAPDGSLIVADWYDPGVGGHAMGDLERGRLFRVAPPGAKYEVPKYDYSTPQGAAEALKSPNLCARQVAWTTLHAMQAQAEPALKQAFEDAENPRQRARALWLLGLIPGRAEHYIRVAMNDASPDIRLTAVRLARRVEFDIIPVTRKLLRDPAPQVRRELLIALRHHPSAEKPRLWAELAAQHDGTDRWYLEALGLAADGQWDACLDAYLAKTGPSWNTPAGRDIIWRSRAAKTPSFLTKIMNDPAVPVSELPQYFRAFDFVSGDEKNAALIELAFVAPAADPERQTLIAGEALARLPGFDIQQQPRHAAALLKVLDRLRGTPQFVELVGKFRVAQRYGELLQLAQEQPESQLGADAARQLLALGQLDVLRQAIESPDANTAAATLRALGSAADGRALEIFRPVMDDDSKPLELRRQAVRGVAKTRPGALWLITLAKNGKLRDELKDAAAMELHLASAPDIKTQAEQLFPLPAAKDKLLPPLSELLKLQGDAGRGKIVFETTGTCAKCHVVNGAGKQVGPDLSEIGDKLSRPAFFESILYPSAGISHSYESHTVATKDGDIVTGILTSDTPEAVTLKLQDGLTRTVAKSQIEQMERSKLSMMPADLQKLMSAQDLADVVEYMTTLRKGKK